MIAVAAQFVGPKTQPTPPAKSAVQPGTYSSRGGYVTFLVPAGAGSVLDFSVAGNLLAVNCAGGGSYYTPITILKTAIKRNRTFTATMSQSGVLSGLNARWTYSVTGRFQGNDAAGAATAAGVHREDIVFTDTPNRKCTSNNQPWTATRTLPPPKKSIEPGTYSSRGGYVTFLVPAGAGSVLDFSVAGNLLAVNCAGGGSYYTPITILKTAIKRNRTFTATMSQSGVLSGLNAKWTYSVTGRFQGNDAAGAAIAAGVHRENIVFTDTPGRTCTSNEQPWTATRTR